MSFKQSTSLKQIQLAHGGGGLEMAKLIRELFFTAFDNPILAAEEDAAVLNLSGPCAFTTDSFTVSPLFFAGGDIGKLAIAGTVNDLAMMGAEPQYLSLALVIEEGFELAKLRTIIQSMAAELAKSGARIVCGDTKVVPKGCADGLFINTTGVGRVLRPGLSAAKLQPGDAILVSGDIGRHGAAILMAREGLQLESDLISDCASLWQVVEQLLALPFELHAMRDATRGGIAAVLNEWAVRSGVGIALEEARLPISDEVQGLCELYGFEATDLANEGTFVLALPKRDAEGALEVLRRFDGGSKAAIIGEVCEDHAGRVVLTTAWGGRRYLDLPQGELLPRIC
ncbi:hydrogenase expression/formation protein HypE [Shewanella cyperi]|uniref:Hydrogenase expression/formation protein HypE n=1 Tax=Shewanella cyperi TaxID=2814292 RepID=A0A974XJP4_9GAMM|nr:hydrogenase expression/formation protein HypE [Shewanella cyperi]QSX28508.1 hydrogenase expression/formation protein HypE [Shewanella cyperi]